MNININDFLNVCMNAVINCQQCSMYSLGRVGMEKCLKISNECSNMCSLASYLITHSESSKKDKQVLTICKEICDLCIDECSKFDYEFTQECLNACRKMSDFCETTLVQKQLTTV